jgi:heme A synthase
MRGFRRLAGTTISFTFILIVLGAVVRSTGSGLACPDWPQCYGLWLPTPESLAGLGGVDFSYGQVMLEWTHRLIAGVIVGPLVLWLVIKSIKLRHESGALPLLMISALLLVLIQAGLGGVTVLKGNIPWSVAIHLSVALVFLAVLIFAFLSSERQSGIGWSTDYVGSGARTLTAMTLIIALVTISSGAITAKSGASFACGSWPLCEGFQWPDLSDWAVRIHMGHRVFALSTVALIVLLYITGVKIRREAPRFYQDTRWAFFLVIGEVGLGALVVFTEVPLWGAVIHQAFGALLFAVLSTAFLRPFVRQRSRFGND